jgi:hypothetical protein
MNTTNNYLELLKNSNKNFSLNNYSLFRNLIVQPKYLYDFQTNKKQIEITNINLEQKKRLELITNSKLCMILIQKLLTY